MSDGVDETVVLLVAANFADQKTGIKNKAGGDCAKKDDAEKNFKIMLPIQNDPAETDGNRNRG